jgi:hypothetical protein
MSYRVSEWGVVEIATGLLILPYMHRWREYEQWLAAGNEPLPPLVVTNPPTQAELDAQAELAARETMRTALKADATINYLRTHTPVEVAAYVNANVTDFASAKAVLVKLAMVCAYNMRERLAGE